MQCTKTPLNFTFLKVAPAAEAHYLKHLTDGDGQMSEENELLATSRFKW